MKSFNGLAVLMIMAGLIFSFTMCKKDKDPEPDPIPTPDKRSYLYDKWWYNIEGLGDYKFNSAKKTYEYMTPMGISVPGTWYWYPGTVDSMKVIQNT